MRSPRWPARCAGPLSRAALGALGAWWALLAAPLLGRETLGGARQPPDGEAVRGAGDAVAAARAGDGGGRGRRRQ